MTPVEPKITKDHRQLVWMTIQAIIGDMIAGPA